MATYYIDPAGNDGTGDGSSGNPWKKLSYACSQVAAGAHTIHVNAGTYTEDARCVVALGVSIEGAGEALSIINTTYNPVGADSYDGSIYVRSASPATGNQSISYLTLTGTAFTSWYGVYTSNRHGVKIHHCTFENFRDRGVKFWGNGVTGNHIIGNEFHDCTIIDSADRTVSGGGGLLHFQGQDTMLIYNNYFDNLGRTADASYGNIISTDVGHNKNIKIYNNEFHTLPDSGVGWSMAIEHWDSEGGIEIYNNEFYGGGTLDMGGYDNVKGAYDYSFWVHDNTFDRGSTLAWNASREYPAMSIEGNCSDIIIERNHVNHFQFGIKQSLATDGITHERIYVRYNIFENCGVTNNNWGAAHMMRHGSTNTVVDEIYFYNNVFTQSADAANGAFGALWQPSNQAGQSTTNLIYKNNIIKGFTEAPFGLYPDGVGGTITSMTNAFNILYQNGNSDNIWYDGTAAITNLTESDNLKANPKFTSSTDFTLQDDSPAIDSGDDVGLTSDFILTPVPFGSAPDRGAYEWWEVVPEPPPSFTNITLVSTPACVDPVDPTIISRWVATECPINFRLLRRDWYVISSYDIGGFLVIDILGTFTGADGDVISVYDATTLSMYTGTISDSSGDPVLITDIPWVAGMDILYINDHTLYAGYYFEGRLTINGIVEPLTIIASPDSFGYADLDVSAILRTKTRVGKVTNYLDAIMKDTYKSGNFTLEYRGCWWGSAEAFIQEGLETSPPAPIVWYYAECVRSIEQGCNLSEYVATDLSEAKWLNQFETPVYWYGLPFDISFIIPEIADLAAGDVLIVTIKVYDSENNQLGVDITENVDVDSLEGFVNNYAIDSALIPVGAAYFTVSITAM